ncbi:hypothetical protein GCM10027295_06650 [Pseudaeromonas pectinilytica]
MSDENIINDDNWRIKNADPVFNTKNLGFKLKSSISGIKNLYFLKNSHAETIKDDTSENE